MPGRGKPGASSIVDVRWRLVVPAVQGQTARCRLRDLWIAAAEEALMSRGEVRSSLSDGRLRRTPVVDRIMAKVEKVTESGCWIFMGALRGGGYGCIGSGDDRMRQAHVALYEETTGPVPPTYQLDHKCRVRCCVNPDHLEPVTVQVNLLRGQTRAAANAAKTVCPKHGTPYHDSPTTKQARRRICRRCMADAQARQRARKKGEK